MRRSVRVAAVLAIALAVVLVGGCASTPGASPSGGPVRVDATADGTTVQLAPGAELVVALEGNPTTGFDWRVAGTLPPQLTAKSDTLESSAAPGVVGAGGTRVFTYTVAATGTGVLDMEYLRSWETTVPPEKTFKLTVVVK
jgi:predicted secreted protein